MKAYKSVSFTRENKLVLSYATVLSIIGCLIFLSPVLAQEPDSTDLVPRTKVIVHKDYDNNGNLQRYDSTWSESWSSGNVDPQTLDSLMTGLNLHGFNFNPWLRSPGDSISGGSFGLNDEFFNDFFDPLGGGGFMPDNNDSTLNGQPHLYGYAPDDSTLNNRFQQEQMYMMERLQEFMAEHRKLMEKYFGNPMMGGDQKALIQPQQNSVPPPKSTEIDGSI